MSAKGGNPAAPKGRPASRAAGGKAGDAGLGGRGVLFAAEGTGDAHRDRLVMIVAAQGVGFSADFEVVHAKVAVGGLGVREL